MECNKEEAIRAKEMAEKKMEAGDFVGAQKLVAKAQRLFPGLENITQLITICEVHWSAQNKIRGLENWYGILQVEQSADEATIKKQYRKLALLLHPDKNKFAGAEAAFKLVGEANRLLTDKSKRSQYDMKYRAFSRAGVLNPAPPQSNTSSVRQHRPTNHSANGSTTQVSHLAFWTCCQFCGMRYKYLREYVNRVLRCQTCQKCFTAYDIGFEVVPPGPKQVPFFSRKDVPGHGPPPVTVQNNFGKPPGRQSANRSTAFGQAPKPGNMGEVGKGMASIEKGVEKDMGCRKNDVEIPQQTAAKPQSEATKPQPDEADPQPCAARPMPEVMRPKHDVAKSDEMADSKSKVTNWKKKAVEESSGSFETKSGKDNEKDGVQKSGHDFTGHNSDENEKRRSSRKKRRVLYAENGSDDDFVSPPLKKPKASRSSDPSVEVQKEANSGGLSENSDLVGPAVPGNTCKKEVKQKRSFAFGESPLNKENRNEGCKANGDEEVISVPDDEKSNDDNDSEPNKDESKVIDCLDPEFNDFDKDKMDCFAVNQIWALYDPKDGMPRFYARVKKVFSPARVKKVFSPGFKLKITWLEPLLDDKGEEDCDGEDMPISCGKFENGATEDIEDHLMFSHQMHYSRDNSRKSCTLIHPRKGETWALFRNWDSSWITDPEKHQPPYQYDFVEILTDFSEDHGIGVRYLGKVKGFVSLFQQAEQHGVIAFTIQPGEIYRFSHRAPSFRMTGKEKEGVPVNSFELDPASLPANIFELGNKGDSNINKQNLDNEAEANAVGHQKPSINGGPSMLCKSPGEASSGVQKDQDKVHANRCWNEKGKNVISKGSSASGQVDEMNTPNKLKKGSSVSETLRLRRSPRGLSEKDAERNASQSAAQDTDKPNNDLPVQSHGDVSLSQSAEKVNIHEKLAKDACVTDALKIRRSPRVSNQADGQSNGNQSANGNIVKHRIPNICDNVHDLSSPSKGNAALSHSDGSHSVTRISKATINGKREDVCFDFKKEKSEDKFLVDQIWALYSSKDGMPKDYAQVKKIDTEPEFKLHVVLLEACSMPKYNTRPVCCGVFKVKSTKTKIVPPSSFSHQLQVVQIDKNKYEVYPRKGEIWALYKTRNSDSACSDPSECDIVEVLEGGQNTKLMVLTCVNGSKSLYRSPRSQRLTAGIIDVPRTEIARFSHQIPAFRHTGLNDRLRGFWELDISAVPSITIVLD